MSDRHAEDLDPRLAARLRTFADQALGRFDVDQVVSAVVTTPERQRPTKLLAVTAALAATAGAIAVVIAGQLLAGTSWHGTSPGTAAGVTLEQAIEVARDAAPHHADKPIFSAEAGPFGDVLEPEVAHRISPMPPPDRWVWIINLAGGPPLGQEGAMVVLDFVDGRVLGVIDWES